MKKKALKQTYGKLRHGISFLLSRFPQCRRLYWTRWCLTERANTSVLDWTSRVSVSWIASPSEGWLGSNCRRRHFLKQSIKRNTIYFSTTIYSISYSSVFFCIKISKRNIHCGTIWKSFIMIKDSFWNVFMQFKSKTLIVAEWLDIFARHVCFCFVLLTWHYRIFLRLKSGQSGLTIEIKRIAQKNTRRE